MRPESPTVGELRPSQLLHTCGVGAIVDLPHLSVMVLGLDAWEGLWEHYQPITEDRLLQKVRSRLGGQVAQLRFPPMRPELSVGLRRAFEEEEAVGVPVASFPRWMRCPACNRLAPLSAEFKLKTVPGRPDLTKYVHAICNVANQPVALPARFLFACEAGHLDDFPWVWFVHRGDPRCRGRLVLRELGVSGEASDVLVECSECGAKRSMAEAFGREAGVNLPQCRGRRPQLKDFQEEPCEASCETILIGASNSWFAVTVSVLHVPLRTDDRLGQLVDERWEELSTVQSASDVAFMRRRGELADWAELGDEELWRAIEARHRGQGRPDEDIKAPEWRVLSDPDPRLNGRDFHLTPVEPPARWSRFIRRVVLADRLREVTALTHFTRIASPRELGSEEDLPSDMLAPISRTPPTRVPACDVRGEGIFLTFDEQRLREWVATVGESERAFRRAHGAFRRRRAVPTPEAGFPGMRYIVLHSIAHALMRQLALECGYTAASLRERIYSRGPEEGEPMAGVLIYTAAPDSEGTLGGLVRIGTELHRHLHAAMTQMELCSSDPLCADHRPDPDGSTLHGAACHACLFAPETSCERGNKYLDRSVLVPTLRPSAEAFLDGWRS